MSVAQATGNVGDPVVILILGTGWTTSYLQPLLAAQGFSHVATSSSGRSGSIPFKFDPLNPMDSEPYSSLPNAKMLLVTFPLRSAEEAEGLVHGYLSTRRPAYTESNPLQVVLLGSTGIWKPEHRNPDEGGWTESSTPHDTSNPRGQAEDALLGLKDHCVEKCVLNLSGLYGGQRQPWNWISRVASSKENVKGKGSLHLVHGEDVARAILGVHLQWESVQGKRWIVTDLRVYDWWEIILRHGDYARRKLKEERRRAGDSEQRLSASSSIMHDGLPEYEVWVRELMDEEGVKALPRKGSILGRRLDGREFWRLIEDGPREWMGAEWGNDAKVP